MSHPRSIVWIVLVCIAVTEVRATAQGRAEVSAGPVAESVEAVGWYIDGVRWIIPGLAVVGEANGYYNLGSTRWRGWHGALGGLRLDTRPQDRPSVFGQVLAGLAISGDYPVFLVQPGLGVRVPLNRKWAFHVRADIPFAVTEFFGTVQIGGGVSRSFGR